MEPQDRIGPSKEDIGALFKQSYSERIKNNNEQTANELAVLDVLVAYNQQILEELEAIKEAKKARAHVRL